MNSNPPEGRARCVMVLGTTSGAGKSWLATALCRWYARQGLEVAPFKAQNMSNNARVVAGGEIGSAQYFQALAARAEPDVRMNPLLLKPERDTHSQVVLLGQVSRELSELPWRGRSERVWPQIAQALDALRAAHDVVVIEGAGSPAEINLMASDIVNLRVARHADARCLLVTDIDRGGAFAHLYGTWALMPPEDRARLAGFVLNKFRGDASLFADGMRSIVEATGWTALGLLPYCSAAERLPAEDALGVRPSTAAGGRARSRIVVLAYPRMANFDDLDPLRLEPGVDLEFLRPGEPIPGDAALVVLPGSKATIADLGTVRDSGWHVDLTAHVRRGGRVLGICGGYQMLGRRIADPDGREGPAGAVEGLGLLEVETALKTLSPSSVVSTSSSPRPSTVPAGPSRPFGSAIRFPSI